MSDEQLNLDVPSLLEEIERLRTAVALRDSLIDYWSKEATMLLYEKRTAKADLAAAQEALRAKRQMWRRLRGGWG